MDNTNYNTKTEKNKHLTLKDRVRIEILLEENYTAYAIAKKLGKAANTIRNEIARGTTTQIKNGKKIIMYLADCGQANYEKNRQKSYRTFKRIECNEFISDVVETMKRNTWSVDVCVNILAKKYDKTNVVCVKTIYNYIKLGLLEIKPIDLPLMVRRKTRKITAKQHRIKLGKSIEERPENINQRLEFGHWEIDTVIGKKGKNQTAMLTIVERQTRQFFMRKIENKTTMAVTKALESLIDEFGYKFNKVFKSITSDNGLEFADLSKLEDMGVEVYFAHPYTSYERGSNEKHNSLIRRFIPKGKTINDYSIDEIAFIEDWCNTLPRKILNYKTPEQLFEQELDKLYAI